MFLKKNINHYFFSKTIAEVRRSMYKFGNNAVFTVVMPRDFGGPNGGQLKTNNNCYMNTDDLLEWYIRLTVDDMVKLSRWFSSFGDVNAGFQEDLNYSLAYFEKNTGPSFFAQAYNIMLRYNKKSHRGPLLFKLVVNKDLITVSKMWELSSLSSRPIKLKLAKKEKVFLTWEIFSVPLLIPLPPLCVMINFKNTFLNRSLLSSQQLVLLHSMIFF